MEILFIYPLLQIRRQWIIHEDDILAIQRQDSGEEAQEATQGSQGRRAGGERTDSGPQADSGLERACSIGTKYSGASVPPFEGACGIPFPDHVPGTAIVVTQWTRGPGIRNRDEINLGTGVHALTVVQYRTKRFDVLLSGVSWVYPAAILLHALSKALKISPMRHRRVIRCVFFCTPR